MPAQRLVIKFGGTSVGSGQAIASAAGIAADLRRAGHPVVVVTSAMSGVTDALLGGAAAAVRGERVHVRELAETLRAKHHAAAGELALTDGERAVVLDPIDGRLTEFAVLCDALAVLGDASPRALDAVSSLGERMSVHLLAGALRKLGTPAVPIDAAEIVRTDNAFQSAAPDSLETRRLTQGTLEPLLTEGIVPVITGFIGATVEGVVTTLGRGGSDYSAAIIGAAMDVDEVWIYTDVDGVMTADPRVVTDVRTLDTLSYREMSELAYFGAKVLHPKTVLPALERGIPIRIRNTFNPAHPGTLVVGKSDDPVAVFKGVTAIRHQSLVTIEGRGMLGVPGHRGTRIRQRRAHRHQRVDDLAGLLGAEHLLSRSAGRVVQRARYPPAGVRARARTARHREHLVARRGRHRHGGWRSNQADARRGGPRLRCARADGHQRDCDCDGLVGVQHQPGGRGEGCGAHGQVPAHADLTRSRQDPDLASLGVSLSFRLRRPRPAFCSMFAHYADPQ